MEDYSKLLSLLQSMGTGMSSLNDGLISFQNKEKGKMMNGLITDSINTGLSAGMQYFANQNNPSLNTNNQQMNIADTVSNSVLSIASKVPGTVGIVSSVLSLGNQLGGQLNKIKPKDQSESKIFNETSAWSGTSSIQNQNLADINNFNSKGLIGQLFGKKKDLIGKQKSISNKGLIASNIIATNKKQKADALASSDSLNQQNYLNTSGFNYDDMLFGKSGMKLPLVSKTIKKDTPHDAITALRSNSRSNKRELLKKMSDIYYTQKDLWRQIKDVERLISKKVEIKKQGGPINIIVDGQLHAHKHAIKTSQQFKDAEITEKGIPVILEDGGEIKQVQELERDELILHYDLTKKIEELKKDGSENAMIEAGKILQKEIVKNTKDNKNKILKNG